MHAENIAWPEQYTIKKTVNVPNSALPALIYRNVFPHPVNAELAQQHCGRNQWEKRGEWGEIKIAHFHPNTHECYAIFRGASRLALGRGLDDQGTDGVEVEVSEGDVIVIPAGVSHRSLSSSGDYRYIGVYPKTAPRWRNNLCKGEELLEDLFKEISEVEIPDSDPVFGHNGPLSQIWRAARARSNDHRSKL